MAMNYYYYNKQIKKYLIQFMSIFAGLQVMTENREDGNPKVISVPVHYGSKDRVTASILSENTQNKPIRLPVMSAYLTGIDITPELRKGLGVQRRTPFLPRGEVFPDGIKVAHQLMPIPYRGQIELGIYTSNMDQHLQILEQIMIFFDPSIQIQISDGDLDWARLSTVEMTNINFDENYPAGTDRRMIVSTLGFAVPMYISAPSDAKNNFVAEVYTRIAALEGDADLNNALEEIDGTGQGYEKSASIDDLNINLDLLDF